MQHGWTGFKKLLPAETLPEAGDIDPSTESYFTSVYVIYYKCAVSIVPLIMRVYEATVTFNFIVRRPDTPIFFHVKGDL